MKKLTVLVVKEANGGVIQLNTVVLPGTAGPYR